MTPYDLKFHPMSSHKQVKPLTPQEIEQRELNARAWCLIGATAAVLSIAVAVMMIF